MTYNTLDLTDDMIDTRNIIERFEELEGQREAMREEFDADPGNAGVDFDNWVCNQVGFSREEQDELEQLTVILDDLKGYGGDEQWRGDWYPLTLIREDYFTEYAEELVKDCEGLPRNLPSYIEIDWEATAKNMQVDYSTIEINGTDYFYR